MRASPGMRGSGGLSWEHVAGCKPQLVRDRGVAVLAVVTVEREEPALVAEVDRDATRPARNLDSRSEQEAGVPAAEIGEPLVVAGHRVCLPTAERERALGSDVDMKSRGTARQIEAQQD